MFIKWDDKYSTKNTLIDQEHKKLFQLANLAHNMIGKKTQVDEVRKVLVALFDYMKTHFKHEEAYMESIKYPGLAIHRQKHRKIMVEMTNLVKNVKVDLKEKLAIIMEQWILNHILQEDMGYVKFVEEMHSKMSQSKTNLKDETKKNLSVISESKIRDLKATKTKATDSKIAEVSQSGVSKTNNSGAKIGKPDLIKSESNKVVSKNTKVDLSKDSLSSNDKSKHIQKDGRPLDDSGGAVDNGVRSTVSNSVSHTRQSLGNANVSGVGKNSSNAQKTVLKNTESPKVKIPGNGPTLHMYKCLCEKTYKIKPDAHANIQAGNGIKCPVCTTFIKYIKDIAE